MPEEPAGEFSRKDVAGITGGAGGLGQAIARSLAEAGVPVALFDLASTEPQARAVVAELSDLGAAARFVPMDVTDPAGIEEAIDRAAEDLGPLSILVNNAGTALRGPTLDVPMEEWNRQVELNLTGAFACAQRFARRARSAVEQGALPAASIVNIASVFGLVGGVNRAAYSATKGALVNLTRTLATEWHVYGIRVNAVAPTFVETPLTRPLKEGGLDVLNRSLGETWAQPSDVADAVRFLASRRARAITGHTLPVDYGWTAW